MKAIGKIKITNELELNDPTMEIQNVTYSWVNDDVTVEVYFTEGNGIFKHSRNFTFTNPTKKELSSDDILQFVANETILSQFI